MFRLSPSFTEPGVLGGVGPPRPCLAQRPKPQNPREIIESLAGPRLRVLRLPINKCS
jgi:hypothetical protein